MTVTNLLTITVTEEERTASPRLAKKENAFSL